MYAIHGLYKCMYEKKYVYKYARTYLHMHYVCMYVYMYVCMYEKTVVVMWYLKCLAAVLRPVHVVEVFDDPTRARSNERDRRLSQER